MKPKKPTITIIMPTYNSERYVQDSIMSVINQSYEDWELIVIDDASKDKTIEIILNSFGSDQRIKVIALKDNQGAAVARNTGLEKANGKYIAFLDSDDLWRRDKLETQLMFMEEKKVAFCFTAYEFLNTPEKKRKVVHVPKTMTYKDVLKNTRIGTLTVMINSEIVGDFRMPLARRGQDLLTWVTILKKGYIAYGIDIPLAYYRTVKGSLSNNRLVALKRTWKNYRTFLKMNFLEAGYYFSFYVFNAVKKHYFSIGE